MKGPLIVFLTALDLEYQAVRQHLTDIRVHRHAAGTRFEVGQLAGGGECRAAMALVGKGNQPAAVLTERAIAEFAPSALLFVGVAGALWPDIGLGDVVVATHVYAYHGGTSEDDGFKARPRVWESSHEPDQAARHLYRSGDWTRCLPRGAAVPEVRFGPIAAGEVVQNSRISTHARWIRRTYNDALAIEMEAAGVAQATHLNRSLPMAVIRGISDRADGTKITSDGDGWQMRAAANAAAFAAALAQELAPELVRETPHRRRTEQAEDFCNTARDRAQVDVQIGQLHGNFSIAPPAGAAADPAAQLTELRDRLTSALEAHQVDELTFATAEEEITLAAQSLARATKSDRDVAVISLMRLRGLLAEVPDLERRTSSIITGLRGGL
ncbi:purine phosphorylase [Nonomuraea sp. NPDC050783]|uniref:5'-methylthioadenosine/S-adenosylhomocysteine nucleosidase family protein n=1 Tax=Nonomuraea sp. NPDC050783 TaxID=3154634 RepID=UPI0034661C52